MYRASVCVVLVWLASASALGTPYWIAWEGDDFPENQGWTRHWGNWSGAYQGPGADRALEGGILSYDSLYDAGVYDYVDIQRNVDPAPGEQFVMEWRLRIDVVTGWSEDPGIGLFADTTWAVGLHFGVDHVTSAFEADSTIALVHGVFHDYQLVSNDMRMYELRIDGELVRVGSFWESLKRSNVGWGDSIQGAASLHEWEYFRFGVVPEPWSFTLLLGTGVACCGRRRG